MSETVESIKGLIDMCSEEERRAVKRYLEASLRHPLEEEWGVDAETILSAIRRSSDLTKRGVRGIIAEAVFETSVLPRISAKGWKAESI
jgi:hypothetical protein